MEDYCVLNKKSRQYYIDRGNEYFKNHDIDNAIKAYSIGIKIYNDECALYNNRGLAYMHKEDYRRAIDDYVKAIKFGYHDIATHNNLAAAYSYEKIFDKAVEEYTKIIEINPNFKVAYLSRGQVYFNSKRYKRALKDFEKALEIDPNFNEAYEFKQVVMKKLKNKISYEEINNIENDKIECNELMEKEIERKFNATNIMSKKAINENCIKDINKSIEIFKEITMAPKNEYTGGAYVNIAELKTIIKLKETIKMEFNEDSEIESNYIAALNIKPTNQVALSGIAIYYFYTNQYDKSLTYMNNIENCAHLKRYLDIVCNIDLNYNYLKISNNLNKIDLKKKCDFYDELYKRLDKTLLDYKLEVGILYSNCCVEIDEALDAYNMLQNLLKLFRGINLSDNIRDMIYSNLSTVCLRNLGKPIEALKYLNKIKNGEKQLINSNKALCHLENMQLTKAIDILEVQVKKIPNNTDYYNLAKAYYLNDDYTKALDNIKKARYFFEDETSYTLAASIYRKLGNVEESINLAKEALYFFENQSSSFITKKDNLISYSSFNVVENEKTYEMICNELSKCYLSERNFDSAYAVNKLALERYPYNNKFKENIEIIEQFIDIQNENLLIKEKIEMIKLEKENFKIKSIKAREWVVDLIKCQNNNQNINDLQSKSWEIFDRNIENIIQKMKNEIDDEVVNYDNILKEYENKFNNISHKALHCLSTAEYLYQSNKNSFIDFAPIIVEFSKTFEIELNEVLRKTFNKKNILTLGQILFDSHIRNSFILT